MAQRRFTLAQKRVRFGVEAYSRYCEELALRLYTSGEEQLEVAQSHYHRAWLLIA